MLLVVFNIYLFEKANKKFINFKFIKIDKHLKRMLAVWKVLFIIFILILTVVIRSGTETFPQTYQENKAGVQRVHREQSLHHVHRTFSYGRSQTDDVLPYFERFFPFHLMNHSGYELGQLEHCVLTKGQFGQHP